ncbi:glycosyltransferase [Lachnospiraceae bacterium ZAX-1]
MKPQRKILILLPSLEQVGGVMVVAPLLSILLDNHYKVDIISKVSGLLGYGFEKMGCTVGIYEDMHTQPFRDYILYHYDEVLVNTLQLVSVIHQLNGVNIKVHWWIHEGPHFFERFKEQIPDGFWDMLKDNIRVYVAGAYVNRFLLTKYNYTSEILNFGSPDYGKEKFEKPNYNVNAEKISFLIPSTLYQYTKGQDITAVAIASLPLEYLQKTEFIFVGCECQGETIFLELLDALEEKCANVHHLPTMLHKELLALMNSVDCILAPSREDPTNTCIVEGLSLSKICICSNRVGASYYLKHNVNAFIFTNENADELKAIMMDIIDDMDTLEDMKVNGHKVYEEVFSLNKFEDNVKKWLINN